LEEALTVKQPEIFNSDQGSQFTATAFTSCLEECGVAISMDGRGRVIDNVFVERIWRSVKYEGGVLEGLPRRLGSGGELTVLLSFYSHERIHQALSYRTPAAVYGE
jgi:putative transposase